jgi:hypothetical protein
MDHHTEASQPTRSHQDLLKTCRLVPQRQQLMSTALHCQGPTAWQLSAEQLLCQELFRSLMTQGAAGSALREQRPGLQIP